MGRNHLGSVGKSKRMGQVEWIQLTASIDVLWDQADGEQISGLWHLSQPKQRGRGNGGMDKGGLDDNRFKT